MIAVTGGAGFIGSNIVHALLARGTRDVLVVDDLRDGAKFENLVDLDFADYLDKDDFIARVRGAAALPALEAVIHQGACSDTMEWDGRYMLENNHAYSRTLLEHCLGAGIPFLYASSAAVYGAGEAFRESPDCERPLNVYGYSKLLFDRYVRRRLAAARSQVAGLRYFNVYGPREQHKGRMASVAWHLHGQVAEEGRARLFRASDGYGDGEQRRDFVYVVDVVDVNLWLLDNPAVSGVFNVGTGRSQSFNDVARAVIAWHGKGEIEYVPFPDALRGCYQSFTEADLGALRAAGYPGRFRPVEEGVAAYLDAVSGAG